MGAILIHPKDKQAIYKYLKDMDVEINGFLNRQMDKIEGDDLAKVMNQTSKKLSSNKFPFEIEYIFSLKLTKGEYDKDLNKITIVFSHFSDWHMGIKKDDRYAYAHVYNVNSVDFESMIPTFMHEFTHFIQNELRTAKSGNYKIPDNYINNYYKQGWERQAHAIGYLEKLKREMKIRKPEAILSQLRKMGVLHNDELNQLKHSDYKSWKAIMKQAIMATLADLEDRKTTA